MVDGKNLHGFILQNYWRKLKWWQQRNKIQKQPNIIFIKRNQTATILCGHNIPSQKVYTLSTVHILYETCDILDYNDCNHKYSSQNIWVMKRIILLSLGISNLMNIT